jgi:hypothetical protein
MVSFSTAGDLLLTLLAGGVLGALGQGIRAVVGLKKLGDESAQVGKQLADLVVPSRMVVSLLIGFIAGALGILAIDVSQGYPAQTIVTLIGIGYAGADFIEGFFQRHLPGGTAPAEPAMAEPDAPAVG